MGGAISAVREAVKTDTGKEEALETLKMLETMAKDYMDSFYQRIENSASDAKEIPIERVLTKHRFVRTVTKKGDNIGPMIQDCVKQFSSGPTAEGLGQLAGSTIKALLGASSGQRSIEELYSISLGDALGLSRLDVCFFSYSFESTSIINHCEAVVACCVVVSSADVDELTENTVRVLVDDSFSTSPRELKNLIADEIGWKVLRKRDRSPLTTVEQAEYHEHRVAMSQYWEKDKEKKEKERKEREDKETRAV